MKLDIRESPLFVFEFFLDCFSTKIKCPKNILAIRIDSLGDVCTSIPALYLLKKKYPDAKLGVFAKKFLCDFLKGFNFIDNSFPYKRSTKLTWGVIGDFMRLLKGYDSLWIVALRENYPLFFASLPFVFKYRRFSRGSTRVYYKLKAIKNAHEVDSCIQVLTPVLTNTWNHQEIISNFNFDLENLNSDLQQIINTKKYLLVHPGAGSLYRKWPRENFVSFVNLISKKIDYCFIIGGKGEEDDCDYIQNILKGGSVEVINLANKLNLRHVAYLMHKAWLFICNDSGPMHLASLFNANIFALFGPADPVRIGPWSKHNRYFLAPTRDCWPCDQNGCKYYKNPCIHDIKPGMISEALGQ